MATKREKPTKAKPSDETWDTQRFREQCFLASFWRPISNFYRQQTFGSCLEHEGPPIYNSKHTLNQSEGYASPEFLTMLDCKVPQVTGNLLTSVKDVGGIVNIKNNLKALLVPRLQIYKLLPIDDNSKGISADNFYADKFRKYEYPFPAHIEMQDAGALGTPGSSRWKNKEKNSFGIESFTVKTTATDQSQVDAALVTCNLNLYFSSIHDLFEKRDFFPTSPDHKRIRDTIASLITNTDKVEEVKRNSADADGKTTKDASGPSNGTDFARSFIIMASIGWQPVTEQQIQRADPLLSDQEREDFFKAIDKCKQNIILYLVQYKFDIKEDGTVKLSIEYAGNVDTAYGSNKFDILGGEISEDKIEDLLNKEAEKEKGDKALALQARRAGHSAIKLSRNSDKCTADLKAEVQGSVTTNYSSNCHFRFAMSKNLRSFYSNNYSNVLKAYDDLMGGGDNKGFDFVEFINEFKSNADKNGIQRLSSIFNDGFLESIMGNTSSKGRYSKVTSTKFANFINVVRSDLGSLAAKESVSDEELIRRIKAKYKISQYRNVMENLYQEGKIHFIEMDIDLYESWKVWLRREQIGGEYKVEAETEDGSSRWDFIPYKEYESFKNRSGNCKPELGCYLDKDTGIMIYNIKKALEANNEIVTKPSALNKRRINFMYFADILDAAIKTIRSNISQDDASQLDDFVEQFKKKRIVLGNVILQDKILFEKNPSLENSSYKKYSINIGDLPVSLHSYVNWFQKRASNLKLEEWSLKRFIMDCARVLLSDAFGYGCDPKINQRTNIRSVVIESYRDKDPNREGEFIDKIPLKPRVVLTDGVLDKFKDVDTDQKLKALNEANNGIIGFTGDPGKSKPRSDVESDEICTILYIFGESFERNNLKADKTEDEKMGIYHFNLGQDKGLIKSIKFEVDKDSILRTVRIVDAQDSDNNLSQIRDIYNANVSMIGNPLFRPGMIVYIDPTLPGYSPVDPNSKALIRNIGMGGYYMILNINHSISNGEYKTDLTTVAVVTAADIRNQVSEIAEGNEKILFPESIEDINEKTIPLYIYKDRLKGS